MIVDRHTPQSVIQSHLAKVKGDLVIDFFAGGGGVSEGIRKALGFSPRVAVNHDLSALTMHEANHPDALHFCENVWRVDPKSICFDPVKRFWRRVALFWLSPDCRHFSRAKGSKPVSPRVRGLAHIAIRWAETARPFVIVLENVREFRDWGPLIRKLNADGSEAFDIHGNPVLIPDPTRKGQSFKRFVGRLRNLGYVVEWRDLDAADYGAPTHRRRLFLVARRDGVAITWPEKTHGAAQLKSEKEKGKNAGGLQPFRTAAECIDWSLPCHSIFMGKREARKLGLKRPLARNTLKRIAAGFVAEVMQKGDPFIVTCNHSGKGFRGQSIRKARLITAFLIKYYGTGGAKSIGLPVDTLTSKARYGLVLVIRGEHYLVVDICMRMLTDRELALCQGFDRSYKLTGTKTQNIAKIGNSVPPQLAEAVVRANCCAMARKAVAS